MHLKLVESRVISQHTRVIICGVKEQIRSFLLFSKKFFFDTRHQSANDTKGNVRFALCGLSVWMSDAVTASTLSMNYLSCSRESVCNDGNLNARRPRLYDDWNVHNIIWLKGVSLHWRAPKISSRDVPWIRICSINSIKIRWVLHHQHDLISNKGLCSPLPSFTSCKDLAWWSFRNYRKIS